MSDILIRAKAVRAQLCMASECTYDEGCGCLDAIATLLKETAALRSRLESIERETVELRTALKPFADAWVTVTSNSVVHHLSLAQLARLCECEISGADYQKAARSLSPHQTGTKTGL